jgi:hypothetical protein
VTPDAPIVQEMKLRDFLVRTSWLPLVTFFLASLYVERYDGWGRWAAAPILLPAVLLSAIMGGAGAILLVRGWRRTGRADPGLALATFVASTVLFWVLAT